MYLPSSFLLLSQRFRSPTVLGWSGHFLLAAAQVPGPYALQCGLLSRSGTDDRAQKCKHACPQPGYLAAAAKGGSRGRMHFPASSQLAVSGRKTQFKQSQQCLTLSKQPRVQEPGCWHWGHPRRHTGHAQDCLTYVHSGFFFIAIP